MKKRRGHGEGGIRKRADGRWEAAVDLGWEDGRRQRKFLYARTRNEVAEKLRQTQSRLDSGRPMLDERIQLGAFLDLWLLDVIKPHRSHGHWRNCEASVRLYIRPALGKIRLSKLTATHVQHLITELRAKGLADDTVRLVHATLRAALGVARRRGQVYDNVATLIEPISVRREEVTPFTEAELGRLLALAEGDRLGAYLTVAVSLGLRPGEARALRWIDLDLDGDKPSLFVRNAFSRSPGGEALGPPKTERSRRELPMPSQLVEALKQHRRRQHAERLYVGPVWQDGDFVFAQGDGRPLSERTLRRWFTDLCTRAEVSSRRLYDLRHTAASLLVAQGVHSRYLTGYLGHSTNRLTMDLYAHLMPGARDTADAMEEALGRIESLQNATFGGQFGGQTA
jgi:integrase